MKGEFVMKSIQTVRPNHAANLSWCEDTAQQVKVQYILNYELDKLLSEAAKREVL